MNNIKNLSLFGICLAFVVIALGAWTRLVDAGLGCPDWPGCYGFVVFPTNEAEIALAEARYPTFPYDINKAIPEVVHRYFAAALGFLAIIMVYYSFKQNENKNIRRWTIGLLIFICCQGLFGYLTVSLLLLPIIVTAHLFGGFTTLTLFFLIFLMSGKFDILEKMAIPKLKTVCGNSPCGFAFSDFFRSLDKYKLCLFGLRRFSNLSGNLYARNGLQKWV